MSGERKKLLWEHPSVCIPNWSDEYEVVTKVQQFIKKQGQLLKDALPISLTKAWRQMDAFADLLRSLGSSFIVRHRSPADDEADFW